MRPVIILAGVSGAMGFHSSSVGSKAGSFRRNLGLHAFDIEKISRILSPPNRRKNEQTTPPELFIQAVNDGDVGTAIQFFDTSVVYEDADFLAPFVGSNEVERFLRLRDEAVNESLRVGSIAVDKEKGKVGISFLSVNEDTQFSRKGMASFDVDQATGLIQSVFVVRESNKSGEANLKTLKVASNIINLSKTTVDTIETAADVSFEPSTSLTLPEKYFQAWNKRDMQEACSVFADDVKYDDTAFPKPFEGKDALELHLNVCANAFPATFELVVDDSIDGGEQALVRWHVENNGEELPFTRGSSMYTIQNGKIKEGVDIVEPAVFKVGSVTLFLESMKQKLSQEPQRLVPIVVWCTYMYVVFFSDWFFGLPATALEQRTWEEVRDLSLNFFFVSPILGLPFAPVVHPMLEATFNLLLSWAALFAGFLSDDREEKPNLFPMLPMVAGMQFLTSAFLLPYLAFRSTETTGPITREKLSTPARLVESRLLGVALAAVGTGSFFWGLYARFQDFGPFDERIRSFLELLSIDRVGSSFIVDLIIFGLFQGWLVNDDLKRRGMTTDSMLGKLAKFVPFFGMAAYMTFRNPLQEEDEIRL